MRKSFLCNRKLHSYYIKNARRECTIFNSHTEMIYGIIKTAERSECPSAREISDFSGVHCNLKLII